MSSKKSSSESVRVRGLPQKFHEDFRRACELRGLTQAEKLEELIVGFSDEVKAEFGNLFKRLTKKELRVKRVVSLGANTMEDIVREARLAYAVAKKTVEGLVRRGELIERPFPRESGKPGVAETGYFLPAK